MLANVRQLLERREAHAFRSRDNPEVKSPPRATVRSRIALMALDGGVSGGNPSLSADAVAFCQCVLSVCLPVVSSLLGGLLGKGRLFLLFPFWMFPSK
jgi:hypothetical protein